MDSDIEGGGVQDIVEVGHGVTAGAAADAAV